MSNLCYLASRYRYGFDDYLAERRPPGVKLYVERNGNELYIVEPDQFFVERLTWSFWFVCELLEKDERLVRLMRYGRCIEPRALEVPYRIFCRQFMTSAELGEELEQMRSKMRSGLYDNPWDRVSRRASPAFVPPVTPTFRRRMAEIPLPVSL